MRSGTVEKEHPDDLDPTWPIIPERPNMNDYRTNDQVHLNIIIRNAMQLSADGRSAYHIDYGTWKEDAYDAKRQKRVLRE